MGKTARTCGYFSPLASTPECDANSLTRTHVSCPAFRLASHGNFTSAASWPPSAMKCFPYNRRRSSGSIFSSPKLNSVGASSNPFAVRSSPGRLNQSGGESGDQNSPSAPSCIIAPSKFGAPATSSSSNNNSSSHSPSSSSPAASSAAPTHSVKENHDSADCNGSLPSRPPLLRPSLIGSPSNSSSSHSILKPSTLLGGGVGGSSNSNSFTANINPFMRAVDVLDDDDGDARRNAPSSSSGKPSVLLPSRLNHVSALGGSPLTAPGAAGEDGETSGSSGSLESTPSASTARTVLPPSASGNLFSMAVASSGSNGPAVAATPSTVGTNFVFGQKLHERVANPNHTAGEPTANGTSSANDNLFTVAPKEKTEAETATTNGIGAAKSLSDSARELEEARAAKRKYDEVTVVTGEEDEQNALQVYGKLFTFDKTQGTWIERGRGSLRLNDKQLENQTLQSRLVMRTQGCLRVILNTKIWAEMTIDKTSSKSIRLTAVDGDQIRVFLLMASLKDTETLFNALEWRLATLRAQQSRAAASSSSAAISGETTTLPSACSPTPSPGGLDGDTSGISPKRRSTDPEEEPEEAKKKRSE